MLLPEPKDANYYLRYLASLTDLELQNIEALSSFSADKEAELLVNAALSNDKKAMEIMEAVAFVTGMNQAKRHKKKKGKK